MKKSLYIGKTIPNPLAKDLSLNISSAATAMASAAGKQDRETLEMKLAGIMATCDGCRAKIRDKKQEDFSRKNL